MQPKPSYLGLGLIVLLGGAAVLLLNYPSVLAYLLAGGFWLLVASMAGVIAYAVFWLVRNRISPVTRVRASVVRRRFKEWDVSLPADTPEMAAARLGMLGRDPEGAWKAFSRAAASSDTRDIDLASGKNYFVTFAINGREVEFAVPDEATYEAATEGMYGLLVYQGEQFERFIPNVR